MALFANVWSDPRLSWIGDRKDPELFIWYLGWLPHQLGRLQNPLFTDHLAYPSGANLMWNTSVPFPAFILWPITATFGPVVAYNVLVTAGVATSAWLAYFVGRRYLEQRWLAIGVGLMYGFSPGMLAQATRHPHVMIAVFPPIAWLLGDEILVRQRRRPALIGALAGLAMALQLLTGEELLAVTLLTGGLGAILLVALHPGAVAGKLAYAWRAGGVAMVALLVLAGYPLAAQFFGPDRISGSMQPAGVYVTDVLSFVSADPALLRFGGSAAAVSHFTGNLSENDGYIGLPLIALFMLALAVMWRRPLVRWAGLMALALALLSLGPRLHVDGNVSGLQLPWALVARLPLMGSALPSRLMLTAFLGLAVVVAALVSRAIQARARVRYAALAAFGVALASLLPAWPRPSTSAAAPRFFQPGGAVEAIPPGAIILVTPFSNANSADAMYWQALARYRFRMPEGDAFAAGPYLGPRPSYLQGALDQLDSGHAVQRSPESRQAGLRNLAQMQVSAVVAGPSAGRDGIVQFLTWLLDDPPVAVDGVAVWWHVGPLAASSSAGGRPP